MRKMTILAVMLQLAVTVGGLGCKLGRDKGDSSAIAASGVGAVSFGDQSQFFFGLATAPAHVEDKLDDSWLEFARSGRVAAWQNQVQPDRRLDFWSNPSVEIDLAAATGVTVFRLGIDWGRLVPSYGAKIDAAALKRYQEIVAMVRAKNMRVMMTLFHHSLPRWAIDMGGWGNKDVREAFIDFGRAMVDQFDPSVDYWVIFNEPAVFALLSNVAGIWPGGKPNPMAILPLPGVLKGTYFKVIDNMTASHRVLYDYIHSVGAKSNRRPIVGLAQNVGHHLAAGKLDIASATFARQTVNYGFIDAVITHLDFIGLNYYGAEIVKGSGTLVDPRVEYSESGRAVDPHGMYVTLKQIHQRYNVEFVNRSDRRVLPFIVTENGISDGSDILRPAYLIEHLRALKAVMDEGVPVLGYVFWTISDNWEWADGYCPKFGLVAVDRRDNLKRTKRPSFDLFTAIVKQGGFNGRDADKAWQIVRDHVGKPRPFCRSDDGITSMNEPYDRLVVDRDWRFNKERPLRNSDGSPYEPWDPDIDSTLGPIKDTFKQVGTGFKSLLGSLRSFSWLGVKSSDAEGVTFELPMGTNVVCETPLLDGTLIVSFSQAFKVEEMRQVNGEWMGLTKGVDVYLQRDKLEKVSVDRAYLGESTFNIEGTAGKDTIKKTINFDAPQPWSRCSSRED